MTTKREIKFVLEISKDNDVVVIPRDLSDPTLSAVAMVSRFEEIPGSQVAAFEYIDATVKGCLPDYESWLLVGHELWQTDTRIVRYKKLSPYLNIEKLCASKGTQVGARMIESSRGVKFFDSIRCDKFNFAEVVALRCHIRNCFLIYLRNGEALSLVESILRDGWERDNTFVPSALINVIESSKVLICCPFGEFDDVESGCAVIGRSEAIVDIFESRRHLV